MSDIEVTADFKDAKIFITIFDQSKEEDIIAALTEKTLPYQRILGRKMKMKFTPRLTFKIDHSQDKINRVDELLKEIDHGA